MSPAGDAPRPTEVRVRRKERVLVVTYDDGRSFELPAELLRVESPSAEVQGHGEGKTLVAGKRNVGIVDAEAVGRYAVRLRFDDGHDTGIYAWDYLRALGEEGDEVFARYLRELEAAGLSRDP